MAVVGPGLLVGRETSVLSVAAGVRAFGFHRGTTSSSLLPYYIQLGPAAASRAA